ncbi:hypothetical protein AAMO2058_000780300 [Amorphochlora amoebiformis]
MANPGEIAHITLAMIFYMVQAAWVGYYTSLHYKYASHPAIALRGSPHVLAFAMMGFELVPVPMMLWSIHGYQRDEGMCPTFITLQQIFMSMGASGVFFRLAHITYKLSSLAQARVNAEKLRHRSASRNTFPLADEKVQSQQLPNDSRSEGSENCSKAEAKEKGEPMELDSVKKRKQLQQETLRRSLGTARIVSFLHKRIFNLSLIYFLFNVFAIFWLSDVVPKVIEGASLKFSECQSPAHALCVVGWYFWGVPFAVWLWYIKFYDRFKIKLEILGLTVFTTVTAATYVIVAAVGYCTYQRIIGCIDGGPYMSDEHWAAFVIFVCSILAAGIGYFEIYLPITVLYAEQKEERKMKATPLSEYPPLEDVLIYGPTHRLFEDHLYKEWSPENLEFYMAATRYEMSNMHKEDVSREDLRRIRKQALSIYYSYLNPNSNNLVNLSADVIEPVREHFKTTLYSKVYLADSDYFDALAAGTQNPYGRLAAHSPAMGKSWRGDLSRSRLAPSKSRTLPNSTATKSPRITTDSPGHGSTRSKTENRRPANPNISDVFLNRKSLRKLVRRESRTKAELKRDHESGSDPDLRISADIEANIDGNNKEFITVIRVFSHARQAILKLMENDSYRRFLQRADIRKKLNEYKRTFGHQITPTANKSGLNRKPPRKGSQPVI